MEKDIFCRIVDGEIPSYKIWENEKFLAFLDVNPINLGHTLLIPKKHHDYIFTFEDPDFSEIFRIAKLLAPVIQKATGSKRVGLVVEGFGVPHLHLHLVPINHGGELDPSKQSQVSTESLQQMADKIRKLIIL